MHWNLVVLRFRETGRGLPGGGAPLPTAGRGGECGCHWAEFLEDLVGWRECQIFLNQGVSLAERFIFL